MALITVRGREMPRRYGLARPADLTCIHGHRIRVRGRPFEVAIPCSYQISPGREGECGALIYVVTTRHVGMLWFCDLTEAEALAIDAEGLDFVAIAERLRVSHRRRPVHERHWKPGV